MARTVGQIVATARGILQDQRATYRYSDTDLAGYVSDAMVEARRTRPDLFVGSLRDDIPAYTSADFSVVIPIPDFYATHLANFVAGRAELRDNSFTNDGRAVILTNLWVSALTGGART